MTEVPEQIVVALATIETEGVTAAPTDIVIELDVAVAGDAHASLDVKITVTTSPLFIVVEVNVAEFVPTFPPFTCH